MNLELNQLDNFVDPKIGLCGFRNIGNTCYMNSILQLLIHSKLIVNFLLAKSNPYKESNENSNSEYEEYLKQSTINKIAAKERKKLGLREDDVISIKKKDIENYIENCLTIKLADIINTIIYKGNSCITPNSFKNVIDKKIPFLRGTSQQDSHELLNGILDNLIDETGNDSEPIIYNVPQVIKDYIEYLQTIKNRINSTDVIDEKKEIIKELNEYKKNNVNIINKFNGNL
jgi:ubiquitin C-terminal hydrolase